MTKELTAQGSQYIEEYIQNGGNAKQAALSTGYTSARAPVQANVGTELVKRVKKLGEKYKIKTGRVLKEYAQIAYFDPRELFDKKTGKQIPIHLLPANIAAVISGFEIDENGTQRLKFCSKHSALIELGKFLNLPGAREVVVQGGDTFINVSMNDKARRVAFLLRSALEQEEPEDSRILSESI
jgi:hypothetical protein